MVSSWDIGEVNNQAPFFVQRDPRFSRQHQLAQALMQQGMDTSPIQSHWQGAARLLSSALGGYRMNKLNEEYGQRADAERKELARLLRADDPAKAIAESNNADLVNALAPGIIAQRAKPRKQTTPIVRDFVEGGETVTKQYHPELKTWEVVSRGPRWQDKAPERPTLAQQANNEEIRAARDRVMSEVEKYIQSGETPRDVIRRLTQQTMNTGRDNPEYNQFLARDFATASNRLVGGDPGFNSFMGRLDVAKPVPEPTPPATDPVSQAEDGLMTRIWNAFGFGDEDPQQGSAPASTPPPRKPAQPGQRPEGMSDEQIIEQARDALGRKADRKAVEDRLRSYGIDPARL